MTNTRIELINGLKLIVGMAINSSAMFSFGYMVGTDQAREQIRFNLKKNNNNNNNNYNNNYNNNNTI